MPATNNILSKLTGGIKMLLDGRFYKLILVSVRANYLRALFLEKLNQRYPDNIIASDIQLTYDAQFSMGKKCIISSGCKFDCGFPPNQGSIIMGNQVILGYNVCLYAGGGKIVLGNNIDIGINTVLTTQSRSLSQHPVQDAVNFKHDFGEISIGEGCLIASNVTLLSGTVLGKYCNVTAGAVVQGIYPDHTTLVGNPARPLPRIPFNQNS